MTQDSDIFADTPLASQMEYKFLKSMIVSEHEMHRYFIEETWGNEKNLFFIFAVIACYPLGSVLFISCKQTSKEEEGRKLPSDANQQAKESNSAIKDREASQTNRGGTNVGTDAIDPSGVPC